MIPSYFVAHGAPSLVVEQHQYTDFLKQFAAKHPKPRAIVIFSAHWEEPVQSIGAADPFSTIYDFSGFQDELYSMTYPAPGDLALAQEISGLFGGSGITSRINTQRGLDHGAWAVLKLMYPAADIPVVQLSVNRYLPAEQLYATGKALAELRERDILVIGSGGTVHNLRRVKWTSDVTESWAQTFDEWLQDKLEKWDTEVLFQYDKLAPYAAEAVPTAEHFIPLLLAMGAGDANKQAKLLHRSYQMGNLSLSCWEFQ